MIDSTNQIHCVANFQDLISTRFQGEMNAICWTRELTGDFSEIANKIKLNGNMVAIDQEELAEFQLSEQGQVAREVLLNDLNLFESSWRVSNS